MLTRNRTRASMAWLIAAAAPVFAFAQTGINPTPVSRPGGYAGTELSNIYQQDVGTGYSAGSLNQIALQNARAQVPYFGQQRSSPQPRIGLGLSSAPAGGKPFSTFTPEPTVSPYLNLFREDIEGGSDLNYNTLVRPMLQQQQINQQVQRQSTELARRLQAMSAQSDFNPGGSKEQYPTGHQTVFMYYGHYYPSAAARPRR